MSARIDVSFENSTAVPIEVAVGVGLPLGEAVPPTNGDDDTLLSPVRRSFPEGLEIRPGDLSSWETARWPLRSSGFRSGRKTCHSEDVQRGDATGHALRK